MGGNLPLVLLRNLPETLESHEVFSFSLVTVKKNSTVAVGKMLIPSLKQEFRFSLKTAVSDIRTCSYVCRDYNFFVHTKFEEK